MKKELYCFSPSRSSFYPTSMKDVYVSAGSWPEDAYPVPPEVYDCFSCLPPGKALGTKDGKPTFVDIDKTQTTGEINHQWKRRADREIESGRRDIDILQYGVDVGMSNEGDEEKIAALKRYVVEVSRYTLQKTYPEKVIWPSHPLR